jgi:hypothetical protein
VEPCSTSLPAPPFIYTFFTTERLTSSPTHFYQKDEQALPGELHSCKLSSYPALSVSRVLNKCVRRRAFWHSVLLVQGSCTRWSAGGRGQRKAGWTRWATEISLAAALSTFSEGHVLCLELGSWVLDWDASVTGRRTLKRCQDTPCRYVVQLHLGVRGSVQCKTSAFGFSPPLMLTVVQLWSQYTLTVKMATEMFAETETVINRRGLNPKFYINCTVIVVEMRVSW